MRDYCAAAAQKLRSGSRVYVAPRTMTPRPTPKTTTERMHYMRERDAQRDAAIMAGLLPPLVDEHEPGDMLTVVAFLDDVRDRWPGAAERHADAVADDDAEFDRVCAAPIPGARARMTHALAVTDDDAARCWNADASRAACALPLSATASNRHNRERNSR